MVKFTNEDLRASEYRLEYLKCLEAKRPELQDDLSKLWTLHRRTFGGFHARVTDFVRLGKNFDRDNAENYFAAFLKRPGESELSGPELAKRLRSLKAFLSAYNDFSRSYYFEAEWMKVLIHRYFSTLIDLTKRLELKDPQIRQLSKSTALPSSLFFASWRSIRGESFAFKSPGWDATEDSDQFEVKIRAAFEAHLKAYIEKTTHFFKHREGLRRSKAVDFGHIERLVRWNLSPENMTFDRFLEKYDGINPGVGNGNRLLKSAREVSRRAFAVFKKYGLPCRPIN
jgi:hypothetical protein